MKDNTFQSGLIGGLIGAAIMWLFSASVINSRNMPMMGWMGYRTTGAGEEIVYPSLGGMGMGSSMTDMMFSIEGKSGDEFDRNFMESMIVHHEGAIEMARLALTSSKHQEIKTLAGEIIKAQTKEIGQMKLWQTTWGY